MHTVTEGCRAGSAGMDLTECCNTQGLSETPLPANWLHRYSVDLVSGNGERQVDMGWNKGLRPI